jgi:ABC-type Fe3+ transport system permease subunit
MSKPALRVRAFVPLAGFVVPTVVIGYGFVIPRSCIAGWNELTIGFATTILGACLTYVAGVRMACRQSGVADEQA